MPERIESPTAVTLIWPMEGQACTIEGGCASCFAECWGQKEKKCPVCTF